MSSVKTKLKMKSSITSAIVPESDDHRRWQLIQASFQTKTKQSRSRTTENDSSELNFSPRRLVSEAVRDEKTMDAGFGVVALSGPGKYLREIAQIASQVTSIESLRGRCHPSFHTLAVDI
jgi:hypothetical protein